MLPPTRLVERFRRRQSPEANAFVRGETQREMAVLLRHSKLSREFFMTDSNGGQANAAPALNCLVQYCKDLSFENPNAPRSLGPQEKSPNINVQVNVNAKPLVDQDFEVELLIEGSAGEAANLLFKFELTYSGVFRLVNIPEEQTHLVVMIECPRLLFPFARQIIADSIRNGGFPPLSLDPIDFATLYAQRLQQTQGAQPTQFS
jgi:preprotein translocase subunit SecB